jgi:hypothetical protein
MNALKVKELPRIDRRLRAKIPVLTDEDLVILKAIGPLILSIGYAKVCQESNGQNEQRVLPAIPQCSTLVRRETATRDCRRDQRPSVASDGNAPYSK